MNGKVFCIGGWNGQYGIKQCDMYDPETDLWQTIAPLHVGKFIIICCCLMWFLTVVSRQGSIALKCTSCLDLPGDTG